VRRASLGGCYQTPRLKKPSRTSTRTTMRMIQRIPMEYLLSPVEVANLSKPGRLTPADPAHQPRPPAGRPGVTRRHHVLVDVELYAVARRQDLGGLVHDLGPHQSRRGRDDCENHDDGDDYRSGNPCGLPVGLDLGLQSHGHACPPLRSGNELVAFALGIAAPPPTSKLLLMFFGRIHRRLLGSFLTHSIPFIDN
jgi:hypothetical protein